MAQGTNLEWATLRRLAAKAGCDPRTIAKVARGEKVIGLPAERARKALEKEGIALGAATAPTVVAAGAEGQASEQKAGA